MAKKIELLHTTYDESGNIESQEVVHPLTSPNCIIMENGKTLDEVMGDGIATPTLTHEGTSFKVGVGDSNIEVVDGDVAGMTLKGQSYQNILPKPTTLIMEADEQEFKINDKIDSNIIIDDNIAEIATVKGKTIVNTVQEESGSEYTVLGEDLSGQSVVTTNKPEGNIKGVTLQGQTLVNTIQEPCKDSYVVLGADDGIEISAETGGHGTIEDTVQGGINGAVLEGMTLVDLMIPGGTPIIQMSGEYTYTTISRTREYVALEVNTASSNSWGYFHMPINLAMLKPMTKYLVKGDLHNVRSFKIASGDSRIQISNIAYINETNYVILQTSETLSTNSDVKLFIDIIRDAGNVCSVKNLIMVEYQEGMENWNIPYFEGMKSVQMPVFKTIGKNLVDLKNGIPFGNTPFELTNQHSVLITGNNNFARYNIPVYLENGKTYTLSGKHEGGSIRLRTDSSGSGDEIASVDSNKTFTFTRDTGYYYISLNTMELVGVFEFSEIQLEEGSVATEYEPYQSSTVTTEKNLFDGILLGDYLKDGIGQPHGITTTTHFYTPSYMPIQANEKFRLQVSSDTQIGDGRVYFYDKDYNYLNLYKTGFSTGASNSTSGDTIVTVPNNSNIAYMRVRFYNGIGVQADSVKINKVYELRDIASVKDELDLQTGKLTQRIGEMVLDGSEDWVYSPQDTFTIFALLRTDYGELMNIKQGSKIVSDHYPNGTSENNIAGGSSYVIQIFKSLNVTLEELKNELGANPVTVQYQLATPTIKTIDLQVTDQDDNTIPHIQTQPTVTHITTSSNYLIPTVTIDNNLAYDTIIKPSTLYTVRFKHDTVNADNPLTVDLGGTTQTVTSTEFTITTPSTLTHSQLIFSGKNNVVSEVQVIEGNVVGTQYPFFEGMNDVRITDTSRNVNLFNIKDTVSGFFNIYDGMESPDFGNLTSNYIKVKPNTTYVYNHGGFVADFADYWTAAKFYKDNKGNISTVLQDVGITLDKNGKTYYISGGRYTVIGQTGYNTFQFTTPSDCEYIRIGSRGLSYDGAWATLYQLDNFDDSKFIGRGKNLLMPSILNPIITNSTQNYGGVNFTYNSDGSFTMSGTFTNNITLHGNADEFIKLLKHGARYRTSEMMLMEVFSLDGNTRWTNDLTFDKNNHIRVSPYYQWNGVAGESINKTYYPQIEIGDSQTSYEPYKGVEVQQDVDSIPLTSDMFEQNGWLTNNVLRGMSLQQIATHSATSRVRVKSLIPVKPNKTYEILGDITGWALMFDKNGGLISPTVTKVVDGITTFSTTYETYYLAPVLRHSDDSDISPSDLNSMNLTLQEVPQEIVLRGIGDIKDELDLTRGEYIQRIGEIKLIDQKNIGSGSKTSETWFEALIYLDDYIKVTNNGITKIISNKLPLIGDTSLATTSYLRNNASAKNYIVVALAVEDMGGLTGYDGWHYYVKNNDVVIQYELETPIIHKVNLTNTKVIQSYATETHYETITPSDSLIPNITIPSTLNYNVAIKPSTEYTIRANTSDNLTVDLGGATGTLSNGKVTLTTPATLTHNEVKFSGTGKVKELMVVEGNEIKDNVPFFNGIKNVEMGGIKLVNIARGAKTTGTDVISINTNKTQFTYNGTVNVFRTVVFDNSLFKPNTKYTMYLNITENTSTLNNPIKFLYSGDNYFVDLDGTGIKKVVVTTPNEIERVEIAFRPCTTSQKIVVQNPMIIEGDWTHLDEIPYIESEMIIEQPIIRSQGKNLFDLETKYFNPSNVTYTKSGTTYTVVGNTENYNYGQFAWTTADSWFRNLLGKEVTLSVSSISCTNANSKACIQVRMECTDGSEVYRTIFTNDDPKYETFIIPSNAIDMALQLMSNNTGSPLDSESTLTVSNIQLELGNTATSYEPYKHQTLYSNRVIGYEEGCYYSSSTGTRLENNSYTSVLADVDGLEIAYVTGGSSNYTFFDKDGVFISGRSYPNTAIADNQNGFIIVPSNAKYMRFACGNVNDVYTPYTKATVTGDLPLRSLPNGVCDTLNLVTGEYVQRVKEITFNGTETWTISGGNYGEYIGGVIRLSDIINAGSGNTNFNVLDGTTGTKVKHREVYCYDKNALRILIGKEYLETFDVNGLKQYLSENPITVQYELATPVVRKLGFTTKGNYREQVLDGSETWDTQGATGNTIRFSTRALLQSIQNTPLFTNDIHTRKYLADAHDAYEYISNIEMSQYVNVKQNKLNSLDVNGFIQWLSQNPIKVGYITSTQSSESYSNIHKPIFFDNVNVQYLPNNVDIQPELTYQVRTRNSYVMDMMKANTKYSVKTLSGDGVALIDGTQYALVNNRTFISPPTLTNKELIISGQWYEPMIIEGDVTDKNLPYFKGILSSYHDVDEIEIYSYNDENHNTTLIEMPTRLETVKVVRPKLTEGALEITNGAECASTTEWRSNFISVQPNEFIKVRNGSTERLVYIDFYDINKNFISYSGVVNATYVPDNCYFIRFFMTKSNCSDLTITRQAWKPIQLNSLPNGVYDEIIMKPNSNKAQLVQRIDKVVLDGSENYGIHEVWSQGDIVCANISLPNKQVGSFAYSDRFEGLKAQEALDNTNMEVAIAIKECIRYNTSSAVLYLFINKARLGDYRVYGIKEYLKDNPLTVYYQCNPITHEIQLKGYPYVYENGTVTLNTDTPHQTLVSYNVNQEQLISTQNETIIRHNQQIDDLYYYIEMYLEEIYQMELFRMKLELSL